MRRVRQFLFGFICLILVLGLVPMTLVVDASASTYDGSSWDYAYAGSEDEWIVIDPDVEGQISYITVAESSATQLRLGVALPGMYLYPIEMADGITYSAVSVPGSGLFEFGKPGVPLLGEWILIPNSAEAQVLEVSPGEPLIFEDMELPPVQPPLVDVDVISEVPFTKDEEVYGTDADCPGIFARLEPTKIMRGQECTIIWLYPYQQNPVNRTLAVYPHLSVTVRFQGEPSPIPSRLKGEFFDLMMRRTALNADEVLSAEEEAEEEAESFSGDGDPGDNFKVGWDYIIITDPKFENAADKLAAWRKKAGFTTLVTTAFAGYPAADIKSGLKIGYDYWDIVPQYVLLLGDAEFIPTFYKTWHPFNDGTNLEITSTGVEKYPDDSQGYIGTDLYYATLQGPDPNDPDSDLVPEIIIGRISVDTLEQAMDRVDAIIKYEEDPVTDASFYNNAAICAEFQDVAPPIITDSTVTFTRDDYEDKRCTQTSEDLAKFLSEPQYNIEKSVDRIYYADPQADPSYWSKEPSNFGGGPAGNVMDPIPSYLKKPGFAWDGDDTDIIDAVNLGRFLVTYRGHGGTYHWKFPHLYGMAVAGLVNGDKLPVVWSVACNTGWFDNESDFEKPSGITDRTASYELCFSEEWERNNGGGAVGVIAATRVTYGSYNEYLFWGMTDAIWPNFIPTYYGPMQGLSTLRMGDVLYCGRLYMLNKCQQDTEERQATYEAYQWFGDPATEIRTVKPPLMMAVVSPGFEFPYLWKWALFPKDLTIHVELIDNGEQNPSPSPIKAKVTISKAGSPSDYWVGTTDEEGNVTFPGFLTSTLGEYDVVVTASNCIPFQGVLVSQAGSSGGILLDAEVYSCSSLIEIRLADADLMGLGTEDVSVHTTGGDEETVTLSETPAGTGMFVGTISTASAAVVPGDGTLQVSHGETISAEYYDQDDGTGNPVLVQDTAVVDCQPPVFEGLKSATLDDGCVELQWDVAFDPHGPITYNIYRDEGPGHPIGSLIGSTWGLSYRDCDCELGQTYYYVVRAEDAVGNEDSNGVERSVTLAVKPPPAVPTTSRWGVTGMIILFGALLVWTVRRRGLVSVSNKQG
jgi:hypothetical protein